MENIKKPTQDAAPNYQYQILRLMWDSHPWLTIGTAVTGVVSGFAAIAVIDTINTAMHNAAKRPTLLLAFIGLNIIAILFKNGSTLFPSYASLKIITMLRITLCNKILATPLEEIDKRGAANVLTLLLYAALSAVLFLAPLNLIQVQHYTATAAGAALLPFPLIMFALSRWSGGLVARVGSRLPLTVGPMIAALGLALYARPGIGGAYWTTFFPAVVVLGFGMAVTVAPLTTTVMSAVDPRHAGVASGVNNAVARVAGLLAVAVFGVVLARTFDARVRPRLDHLALSPPAREDIDRELRKIAGADVTHMSSIPPPERQVVRATIDDAFVFAFRLVMAGAAGLALAAAGFGNGIREESHE